MKSVMPPQHDFSMVPKAEIPRSSFKRDHAVKTTFDAGYLIPIYWDWVYPGDTFRLNMSFFARLATPIKPLMDNMYLDSFFFFCPFRLLWTNWTKFCGEQANPADSTTYSIPQIPSPTTPGIVSNTLQDYFGQAVGLATSYSFNAFKSRCYNKCWNSWFRDENLQNSVAENMGDGPDSYGDYVLLRRGKRHDYFTSCLPWPQKGTAVTIPLGTSARVMGLSTLSTTEEIGIYSTSDSGYRAMTTSGTNLQLSSTASDANHSLYADLSTATAASINSLRQAFALQKLYERDARGGTRYYEMIKAHFGVVDPGHAVLQRPIYLGGGTSAISNNPVAQTTASPTTPTARDAQGNLSAFSTVSGMGHGFSKSFTEHGMILGLVSVRADLTYQQGVDREDLYRTRFDMYYPALAHIGEQAVTNQEIYCQANGATSDTLTFGYQERFAEMRYKKSLVTGLFRSNVSTGNTTIDYWHLSQNFTSLPTLNTTFIQETPPVNRVVQVTTQPQFLFDAYIDLQCARPIPLYGVPGNIDRF